MGQKSQHGCVRWALCEHLTSPCHDFACGGLWEQRIKNSKVRGGGSKKCQVPEGTKD